jgi:hypothetical protein
MIKIYSDTKMYVACPANTASGGPELLHQLVYHLRKDLNINAYMYYYNSYDNRYNSPIHPEYEKYENSYITNFDEIKEYEENIFIVPEIRQAINLLKNFKYIRKGVWFLSVGNYYLSLLSKKEYFLPRLINKISKFLIKKPLLEFDITSQKVLSELIDKYDYKKDPILKLSNLFIFQSYYAFDHFNELNPRYYLSDYLNENFLKIQTDLSKKENIVAYNPKKGFLFTKKIIENEKDIKFVPLVNMTRDEVIKTLQKAKIYIDFGNHPGKDRIPREAAILGCCVITGKRGSAAFFEDVPIPDDYKFEDREENIPKIIDKLKDCLKNYEERYKDFEYYRQIIKHEPKKFIEDLRKIFVRF